MNDAESQLDKIAVLLEKLLEHEVERKSRWEAKRNELSSKLTAAVPEIDSSKVDFSAQLEQRQTAAKEQRERLESRYQDQLVYQERLLALLTEQSALLREILEKL